MESSNLCQKILKTKTHKYLPWKVLKNVQDLCILNTLKCFVCKIRFSLRSGKSHIRSVTCIAFNLSVFFFSLCNQFNLFHGSCLAQSHLFSIVITQVFVIRLIYLSLHISVVSLILQQWSIMHFKCRLVQLNLCTSPCFPPSSKGFTTASVLFLIKT